MLARSGHLEYDRVLFFSDAIFAIAITLLVIDIRVPGITNAADELSRAKGNILSFGISFVVIGLFWMGHHSVLRYISVLDRPVIAINLLFLGIVAFLPYPTSLLGGGNGPDEVPTIFYAVCISCAGLAELAVWLYASQVKDLLVPGTSPAAPLHRAARCAHSGGFPALHPGRLRLRPARFVLLDPGRGARHSAGPFRTPGRGAQRGRGDR